MFIHRALFALPQSTLKKACELTLRDEGSSDVRMQRALALQVLGKVFLRAADGAHMPPPPPPPPRAPRSSQLRV